MSLFEQYVTNELPHRPVLLTPANTGYDGDPNISTAPIITDAPAGTMYINSANARYQKNNIAWVDMSLSVPAVPSAVGQVLYSTDGVTMTAETPILGDSGWLFNDNGILLVK